MGAGDVARHRSLSCCRPSFSDPGEDSSFGFGIAGIFFAARATTNSCHLDPSPLPGGNSAAVSISALGSAARRRLCEWLLARLAQCIKARQVEVEQWHDVALLSIRASRPWELLPLADAKCMTPMLALLKARPFLGPYASRQSLASKQCQKTGAQREQGCSVRHREVKIACHSVCAPVAGR
jgi:hypothetical protein